jgi:hypothetical protein
MAVFRKTYQVEEGGTRILDPTIGMGLIYDLSRSGTDLQETEELTEDPPNGYFSYDPNFGYLFFNKDTPFNAGEWVTIIYRAVGIPIPPPPEPPPTCENPTVVASVYNVKNIRLKFGAAGDYMIDIIPSSGTCGDTPVVSATISGTDVYVSGPLVAGSYQACVRKNCGGGLLSGQVVSNTVVIVLSQQNFGARKGPSDTRIKITSIVGVTYETRSGSLPLVTMEQEMRGRHEGFSNVRIRVNITVNKKEQVVVALYKNGPLVQFIAVKQSTAGAAFVLFDPISALPSDDVFVVLGYN